MRPTPESLPGLHHGWPLPPQALESGVTPALLCASCVTLACSLVLWVFIFLAIKSGRKEHRCHRAAVRLPDPHPLLAPITNEGPLTTYFLQLHFGLAMPHGGLHPATTHISHLHAFAWGQVLGNLKLGTTHRVLAHDRCQVSLVGLSVDTSPHRFCTLPNPSLCHFAFSWPRFSLRSTSEIVRLGERTSWASSEPWGLV